MLSTHLPTYAASPFGKRIMSTALIPAVYVDVQVLQQAPVHLNKEPPNPLGIPLPSYSQTVSERTPLTFGPKTRQRPPPLPKGDWQGRSHRLWSEKSHLA